MNVLNILRSLNIINPRKAVTWGLHQVFGTEKGKAIDAHIDGIAAGTHDVVPIVGLEEILDQQAKGG